MGWGWLGTDIQLRRPDMEAMLEEHKRDPRSVRRLGCVTCLALLTDWIAIIVASVLVSIL